MASKQTIRMVKTADGVNIAWAAAGTNGPVLVKASNWLTHLEYDWDSPVWQHWTQFFAEHFRFVRYDQRGCGMSQWDVDDVSSERGIDDLAAVIDASVPSGPFALLGISQGIAAALQYAIEHPERVSHIILCGAYAQGVAKRGNDEALRRYEAIVELTRQGWGGDNPVYRQLFTSRFIPGATAEQIQWWNDLCRRTATPAMATRLLQARKQTDIVELLPRVVTPTLVLHARRDEVVPFSQGQLVASAIPNARFVELDSANHTLLENEPAWQRFKDEVLAFMDISAPQQMIATESARNVFRLEGDTWFIDFAGQHIRLRDLKGLRYLALLFREPNRELHVMQLVAPDEAPARSEGDAGAMLDARAKETYRRRLAEIDDDIDTAKAMGDLGRAEQAEREREFLVRELSRAVGLGGRDRIASSASERARVSATRAVRQAIDRIREHHATLAEHLDHTIKTGTFFSYQPDPRVPVAWTVGGHSGRGQT